MDPTISRASELGVAPIGLAIFDRGCAKGGKELEPVIDETRREMGKYHPLMITHMELYETDEDWNSGAGSSDSIECQAQVLHQSLSRKAQGKKPSDRNQSCTKSKSRSHERSYGCSFDEKS
ncbi:MAG: hypothetical protein Q9212_001890 [Teloschistes hypoglaucus]